MMVQQANKQAAEQLGLQFQSALATTDAEWIEITESMIAAGARPSLTTVPR